MYSETRPWGSFYILDEGAWLQGEAHRGQSGRQAFAAKPQAPGRALDGGDGNCHRHGGRDGAGPVTRSQSIDIPKGAKHRLENRHDGMVEIIEVQFGDYLGEDDIIRYDDAYNRT